MRGFVERRTVDYKLYYLDFQGKKVVMPASKLKRCIEEGTIELDNMRLTKDGKLVYSETYWKQSTENATSQRIEAIDRMRILGVNEGEISRFAYTGKPSISYINKDFQKYLEIDKALEGRIKWFERKTGCKVYHVLRNVNPINPEDIEYTLLYVSSANKKINWTSERSTLKTFHDIGYVFNPYNENFKEGGAAITIANVYDGMLYRADAQMINRKLF